MKPGQVVSDKTLDLVDSGILKALGKEPAGVSLICCDSKGQATLYVGLPGINITPVASYAAPVEQVLLPPAVRELVTEVEASPEDASSGALPGKLRELALQNGGEILEVLRRAGSVSERTMAATALGYANPTQEQFAALIRACSDPAASVRNAAGGAILLGLRAGEPLARQVDAGIFVALLQSSNWSDRNRAGSILVFLTSGRDPKIVALLRERALASLFEMAAWKEQAHALSFRILLGRMALMPEEEVQRLAQEPGGLQLLRIASRALLPGR